MKKQSIHPARAVVFCIFAGCGLGLAEETTDQPVANNPNAFGNITIGDPSPTQFNPNFVTSWVEMNHVGGLAPDGTLTQQSSPAVGLVLFGPKEAETQAEIREDLRVMAHLLRKKAHGGLHARAVMRAMGIQIQSSAEKYRPEARYIEGMGVVFKIPVHFAVAPIEFGASPAKVKKVAPESDWERAKKETLGAGAAGASAFVDLGTVNSNTALALTGLATTTTPRVYDKSFVATIEQALVSALQEAKNIRHLENSDTIVVRILEVVSADDTMAKLGLIPGYSTNRTVMNLRVNVGDVMAFADGKGSEEEFRKKVEVFRYVES